MRDSPSRLQRVVRQVAARALHRWRQHRLKKKPIPIFDGYNHLWWVDYLADGDPDDRVDRFLLRMTGAVRRG